MRVDPDGVIVLSRLNLRSLLAKLDGHPPDSLCTIKGGEDARDLVVRAEDDETHYGQRGYGPGRMHADTEAAMRTKTGKVLTEEEIERLSDEAERGYTLLEILGQPGADVPLARSLAISILCGTPRDHPEIGWEEGLLILARAVLQLDPGLDYTSDHRKCT